MLDPMFHYQFRLIIIGDSTVGKSSLLKFFTEEKAAEICDPTVGVDFYARIVEIHNGLKIKLQLWDTAGQEKFRSITRSYYRNSVGVMVVYDISRRETFEHVASWLHEARENLGGPNPASCTFLLVGHKADLEHKRQVVYEEGEYFAKYHKLKFLETSAMTGQCAECGGAVYLTVEVQNVAYGIFKNLLCSRLRYFENVAEAFSSMARQIYQRLDTGQLSVTDGWDGIKSGLRRTHSASSFTLEHGQEDEDLRANQCSSVLC